MDNRETEGVQAALEILDRVFHGMPAPRREKCETLYNLARSARRLKVGTRCLKASIVELGTYVGNGAVALALGTRDGSKLPVFTIDDYSLRFGWAGERYDLTDYEKFKANVDVAGVSVFQIRSEFGDAANLWTMPVRLLFWDAGGDNVLHANFDAWNRRIAPSGVVAFHDTYSGRFGAEEYCNTLIESGDYHRYQYYPGGIHVVQRTKYDFRHSFLYHRQGRQFKRSPDFGKEY